MDQNLVSAVKETAAYQSMPTHVPRPKRPARDRRRGPPVQTADEPDWRQSALGRLHRREETFNENDMEVMERVERLIWPLVEAFFRDGDENGAEGIFRSELQVLTALPYSTHQAWHSDNQKRGLTIIIPLVDFTTENGPTQVLPGSHNSAWALVAQRGAQVVEASTGSIAAYDSRTYHRGLGNRTREGRPALILCYDREWSPPPGCGPIKSLGDQYLAGFFNTISTGWVSSKEFLHEL